MKLVVGLGNPGQKYNGTRHNVGYQIIHCLAQRFGIGRPKSRFSAEVADTLINNEKTVLISPLTYMNLSGQSVRAAVDFYKIELDDVLIVCDDINLDVGRIRLRPSGSAGGQNGLKDIINRLGTQQFSRLRLGVGKPPPQWDASDYVLGKFDPSDRQTVEAAVERCADAVEMWVSKDIRAAMNRFNSDPDAPKKADKTRQSVEKPDEPSDDFRRLDQIAELEITPEKEKDRG